jgi:hypothetical protein
MGRPKKTQNKTTEKTKKKRKPAVLRVNFVSMDSPPTELSAGDKVNPFETIVFNEVVEAIENTIDFPQDPVELFELKGSSVYITLDKEYFPKVLVSALKHFEKTENYEMCSRCQNLLQTIKI